MDDSKHQRPYELQARRSNVVPLRLVSDRGYTDDDYERAGVMANNEQERIALARVLAQSRRLSW